MCSTKNKKACCLHSRKISHGTKPSRFLQKKCHALTVGTGPTIYFSCLTKLKSLLSLHVMLLRRPVPPRLFFFVSADGYNGQGTIWTRRDPTPPFHLFDLSGSDQRWGWTWCLRYIRLNVIFAQYVLRPLRALNAKCKGEWANVNKCVGRNNNVNTEM